MIFFWPEGKKIENFGILKGNFPDLEVFKMDWPDPSSKKITRFDVGQNIFIRIHPYHMFSSWFEPPA